MPSRPLSQRIAAYIATLACLLFALGVRDTPERVDLPPVHTPAPASPPFERDAVLLVSVVTALQGGDVQQSGTAGSGNTRPVAPLAPVVASKLKVFYEFDGKYHLVGAAATDATGKARIAHLPRGALWITAEAPQMARSSTQFVMDEAEREAELVLGTEHMQEVTVLDEQSTPIANATVLVSTTDPLPYGALSDASGRATVARLGQPPYRIRVSARGYESADLRGIVAPMSVKLRRLGALLVRVEDGQGIPIPEATVMLSGTSLWPARRATTNEKGQANVHGLLAGSFDLKAVKGDRVSRTELGVALARGEQKSLVLRLMPGRMLTVLVTDGDSEPIAPVANADVVVAEGGLSTFPERGRSNNDGRVVLGPFEPGPLSASATARDFVGTSVVPVPEDSSTLVRVALRRGGTIVGRVVDPFDHAIDGATIEIVGTDFSGLPVAETPRYRELQAVGFARALGGPEAMMAVGELGVTQGPIPPIPGAVPGADYLLSSEEARQRRPLSVKNINDVEQWVTRYDGSFRAHPVTPGRLRALARHPAYVEGLSDLVTLMPGASAEVKVVLRGGGSIEGIVVDRWGRSIGGVRVELSASLGARVQSTYTADDGRFAFASLPSEVTLTVARPENPDRPVVRERVTVREGQREPVRIVLPEARDPVEVLVVDDRDQPLEGVEVVLASLEPDSPLRQTRFTGSDGRVSFEDARGLAISLALENPGYATTLERLSKAETQIKLVMRRGVLTTGRVTSVRGRVPVAHARVTVVSAGRRRIASTNSDGVWEMSDVPDGPVHLVIEAPEFPVVEIDRTVERQARQDRALDLGEVDLPDAGGVSGVVVDTRGDPVVGAQVSAVPITGYSPAAAPSKGTVVTDRAGRFRLAPVAVGRLVVHAFAPGVGRGSSEPLEIQRDRDRADVTIKLDRAIQDELRGASKASVAVSLGQAGSNLVIELVAPASEAERSGLRPGDRLIAIDGTRPRDISDARSRLSGAENSDVLLELERQGQVLRVRSTRELVRP
ncbi:MAG TPA: carboxypeptidase regulatory-like domain-containing protein [Polyangiaceae bacterium]|nr:carboxypeptidase regulatory-like domain-containing protein [Polyangiaceae bacterium]